MKRWSLILVCAVGLVGQALAQTACPKEGGSSCKCQTPSGLIDLTPLSATTGAKFTLQNSGITYKYNPCKGFIDGGCGAGTTVCQNSQTTLGTLGTETIYNNPNGVTVGYSATDNAVQVNLICRQDATSPALSYNGKIQQLTVFDLTSCQCCAGGCSVVTPTSDTSPTPSGAGGSTVAPGIFGIVLIVVIIVAFVGYCLAGSIYMSKQKHASGMDIIPNRTFWFEIPSLIWDGMKFSVSPCRQRTSGYKTLK